MTKGRVVVNRYFAGWGKAGLEGGSADPTLRQKKAKDGAPGGRL
jgi:hypothetical protein